MSFRPKEAVVQASKRVLPARTRSSAKLRVVDVRRRVMPGIRPLPDFLVVGAMRAGTSSLFKYLSSHPETAPSIRKEVGYFSLRYEDRDLDWYRSHFPITRARKVFEATPTYLSHPLAAQRIADVLPGVRCVVMLREPEGRARSQHAHRVAQGSEQRSFVEAVMDELERGPTHGRPRWDDYLAFSMYGAQLELWLRFHAAEAVAVFDSEQLYRSTDECLAGIASFVGIGSGGFTGTERNYSSRTGLGVPATDLPSDARELFARDRDVLTEVLGRLPSFGPSPSWLR